MICWAHFSFLQKQNYINNQKFPNNYTKRQIEKCWLEKQNWIVDQRTKRLILFLWKIETIEKVWMHFKVGKRKLKIRYFHVSFFTYFFFSSENLRDNFHLNFWQETFDKRILIKKSSILNKISRSNRLNNFKTS